MPKGDRPNRFKIIPKEDVEKEIALGKEIKPSVFHPIKDMTGEKFADGNVTVLGRYREKSKDAGVQWICKCNLCGNYFYTTGRGLRKGRVKSCGCLVSKKCAERNQTFGLSSTELGRRIYRIHFDIIRKCYNPNRDEYKYFGAKGIYIDPEWYTPNDPNNTGFVNFYNWMIKNGYTLDNRLLVTRIDKKGPYAPWNCTLEPNVVQLKETMELNAHNAQFESDEDRAYFDKKREEYIDKNGFIHLVNTINERGSN